MSQIVKLKGSPIKRRRERIEAFKRFIASNRKEKTTKELVALFALETGLRRKIVEEYLRLLFDSGIYRNHHVGHGRKMLLTEAEFRKIKD